jgi:hypothetical protein
MFSNGCMVIGKALSQGRTAGRAWGFRQPRAGTDPATAGSSGMPTLRTHRPATKAPTTACSLGGAARADAQEAALRRLDQFAFVLDEAFRIPGTRWRIGLDGIAGLVPGLGDAGTALIALYPLLEAWRHGAPSSLILRMLGNIGLDTAIGAVPILGDLFDMRFKANRRNVELLRRHFQRR